MSPSTRSSLRNAFAFTALAVVYAFVPGVLKLGAVAAAPLVPAMSFRKR
jgi:hypothetical protein